MIIYEISQEEFIKYYCRWLANQLKEVLPEKASEFRMLEIARRQHHHDVKHLLQRIRAFKETKENESIIENSK